jgi:auxin efflux carrier family protein
LYEVIGILYAWIIKQFFWVPHQFRYGILVAGGWANVGDIRESIYYIPDLYFGTHSFYWFDFANVATSVIMSVTGAAPFNGTSDQNLSVAYISAFILVFLVNFFFIAPE